jgi:hypothetical protein
MMEHGVKPASVQSPTGAETFEGASFGVVNVVNCVDLDVDVVTVIYAIGLMLE